MTPVERAGRLFPLAVEFNNRIRADDIDDVRDWLLANTDATDRWALLFIQAAIGPTSVKNARQRAVWCALPEVVDEILVQRACNGDAPVSALTTEERHQAIRVLTARGWSAKAIAARLHVAQRQVTRVRRPQPVDDTCGERDVA